MYSFKDRLIYWANIKGAWTHILVAVGIALVVTAIILAAAMPSKGAVNANKDDIGGLKTTMITVVDGLATKASQEELDSFSGNVTEVLDGQAGDISGIRTRVNNAEGRIVGAESDITTLQGDLAKLSNSPPEVHLTGTFGNYTIHAKSNDAGNFTANVHLVYSMAFGYNGTYGEAQQYFYSGINWTETTPSYVTVVTYNGTAWGLSGVWWNVGIFGLEAKTEKAIDITCVGLNSTWEPSFAYVEVYLIQNG